MAVAAANAAASHGAVVASPVATAVQTGSTPSGAPLVISSGGASPWRTTTEARRRSKSNGISSTFV